MWAIDVRAAVAGKEPMIKVEKQKSQKTYSGKFNSAFLNSSWHHFSI